MHFNYTLQFNTILSKITNNFGSLHASWILTLWLPWQSRDFPLSAWTKVTEYVAQFFSLNIEHYMHVKGYWYSAGPKVESLWNVAVTMQNWMTEEALHISVIVKMLTIYL